MSTSTAILAGLAVGAACHVVAFETTAAIAFGLQLYGPNSLWSALQNGLVFGPIAGAAIGLTRARWQTAAPLDAVAAVVLFAGINAVLYMVTGMYSRFEYLAVNVIDLAVAGAIAGGLTARLVPVAASVLGIAQPNSARKRKS